MTNKNEAGQALILTVASLVALMGFAGLAIDMGVLRHDQRLALVPGLKKGLQVRTDAVGNLSLDRASLLDRGQVTGEEVLQRQRAPEHQAAGQHHAARNGQQPGEKRVTFQVPRSEHWNSR